MATERPTRLTDEQKLRCAEAVAAELLKEDFIHADDVEDSVCDLARYGTQYKDGYELAKELDGRCGWDCTRAMLDVLDNFEHLARREIEAAEKQWAADNDIQPPFPLGTRVSIPRGATGVLDGIYEYGAAAYKVKLDGDEMADGPHKRRQIVRFEDVTPLASDAP